MIAKSDVIILVVSASALAAGIYRWQHNMTMMPPVRSTASAPTAAVLNSNTKPPQTISNAVPSNASVAVPDSNAVVTGNISANATLNGAVTTGDTAINAVRNVNAVSSGGTGVENGTQNATLTSSSSSSDLNNIRPTEPLYGTYLVQTGDYLGKIAETFGTTVAALRSINDLDGSLIDINQEILYPLPAN